EDRFEHWPNDVPDLRPALAPGLTERHGVLAPDELAVGVVVEHRQVAAPPQEHWHPGVEADADRRPEALGPSLGISQGGGTPALVAHGPAELPAAGQEVERLVFGGLQSQAAAHCQVPVKPPAGPRGVANLAWWAGPAGRFWVARSLPNGERK